MPTRQTAGTSSTPTLTERLVIADLDSVTPKIASGLRSVIVASRKTFLVHKGRELSVSPNMTSSPDEGLIMQTKASLPTTFQSTLCIGTFTSSLYVSIPSIVSFTTISNNPEMRGDDRANSPGIGCFYTDIARTCLCSLATFTDCSRKWQNHLHQCTTTTTMVSSLVKICQHT